MVLNYYVKISEIPLSSSGKLNRKALSKPSKKDFINKVYVAPEIEIEKIIAKFYSEEFSILENEIGKYTDFFDLGGDSLKATRIVTKNKRILKIKLNIQHIISNNNVYSLAKLCSEIQKNQNNKKINLIKNYNKKEYPITYITEEKRNEQFVLESYFIYNIILYNKILKFWTLRD